MNKAQPTAKGTSSEKVDALLDSVCSLAPAPPVVPGLSIALADVNTDASVIGEMISFDPVLTAKLLRTCNSALLSRGTRVTTVTEAVARLGFQATRRVVLMVLMVERLKSLPPSDGFDGQAQWRHSVTTAFAAQFVAGHLGMEMGTLFTAGLMHDFGKLVLAAAYPGRYAKLMRPPHTQGSALVEAELATLGVSHPEAGARLLERWSCAPNLIAAVRFHHDPPQAGEATRMAACLELADALAYAFAGGVNAASIPESGWPPALKRLRLTVSDLQNYLDQIAENVRFVEALFGLHPGAGRH